MSEPSPSQPAKKLNLREINWLASFPKSGNTWVRFLYQAHVIGHLDINANLRITYSDALPHLYQGVCNLNVSELCREHVALLRGSVLINTIAERSHTPLIIKTHCANIDVNTCTVIPKELTKTSVYMVRDPRDVAVSYARYLDIDIDEAIGFMECDTHCLGAHQVVPQYVCSWSLHYYSWKERANPLIVKYEDMLEDPGYWFKKILETWGVDTDGYEKAVDMANFKNLKSQEKEGGFIENLGTNDFFGSGKKGGWKKKLSAKQAERIENKHNEMMQELGYG